MTPNYRLLCAQMQSLTDTPHFIANLSNAAALVYESLPRLNWAGFYLVEDELLVLGPFQGRPACIEIAFGRGVCGAAWQRDEAILVPDVHAFPGHIACDEASASELVVPIHAKGKVVALLDLDSPEPGRFTEDDREGVIGLAHVLENGVFKN